MVFWINHILLFLFPGNQAKVAKKSGKFHEREEKMKRLLLAGALLLAVATLGPITRFVRFWARCAKRRHQEAMIPRSGQLPSSRHARLAPRVVLVTYRLATRAVLPPKRPIRYEARSGGRIALLDQGSARSLGSTSSMLPSSTSPSGMNPCRISLRSHVGETLSNHSKGDQRAFCPSRFDTKRNCRSSAA